MRIIGGHLKGRRIIAPAHLPVRPTTDFAREALFNILQHDIEIREVRFLDLFAGTGAITFEMASRGCTEITAVDAHSGCLGFIAQTAKAFKIEGIRTIKADIPKWLAKPYQAYDFIFADPPYALPILPEIPELIFQNNWLTAGGLLVLEHPKEHDFENHPLFVKHKRYGNVHFSFFQNPTVS